MASYRWEQWNELQKKYSYILKKKAGTASAVESEEVELYQMLFEAHKLLWWQVVLFF